MTAGAARHLPASPLRAAASAAASAALALALVVAGAPPAHAVVEVRLAQPSAGARVIQATQVSVQVESGLLEEVEWVEARLVRNGETVGQPSRLTYQDGDRSGGTSTWTTTWDPAGGWMGSGGQLANGAYRLQARARSTGLASGEATQWQGNGVTVSLPPASPGLEAQASEDGQAVTLRWSEARAPDFAFYRLERAPSGGSFSAVTQITQRQDTAHVDEPGSPGTWRYRLTAARQDGAGGYNTATAGPVSVELAVPESTPTPTPTPTSSSELSVDDGASEGQGDGSGDQGAGAGDGQGSGSGGDGAGDGQGAGSGDGQGSGAAGTGDTGGGSPGGTGDDTGSGLTGFSGGGEAPPAPAESQVPDLQQQQAPEPQQPESQAPEPQEPATQAPTDSATFSRQLPFELDEDAGQGRDAGAASATPGAAEGQARSTPGGVTDPGATGRAAGDDEVATTAGTDPAVLTVGGRRVLLERVLPPIAGGLLLFVVAGHLLRLRRRLG